MQDFLKIFFLSLFIFSSFINCGQFYFQNLFQKRKSRLNETILFSLGDTKKPIKKEALESARKATWEVGLYLSFQKKEIDFSKNQSLFPINMKSSEDLIHLGHGSGFFISPNLMITSFHVIDSINEHIEIISNRDSETSDELMINKMKLLKVSSTYDLALLESENKSNYFLNIKKEAIDKNRDTFFLLGYPDNRFIFSQIQYNGSQLNRKLFLFDRKEELGQLTGASGGPIIDQNGEIVAVNQSGSNAISIGVSHLILNHFLNGNNRDCSKVSLEKCIQEEWLYLDRSYRDGNLMAKHRMSVNRSYKHWLNKKEKLNQLIEQRQRLNKIEEELAEKLGFFNKNQNKENKDSYEESREKYQNEVLFYNKIVSELNQLFF